ncbi:hypothetical protein AYY16_19370 [Morganella psychrotolerans]|uniref:HindIII family type II restriction endonuclease n=1 Tax=Morganella psychrotolerans TaxID=368603 RepID=UPI000800F199|nr:hypothetical protein AYY16_19370 [Morganella psychrotolerans]
MKKKATDEGILASKEIALEFLSSERNRILRMTKEEAVSELIKINKITSREDQIRKVNNNNILSLS